MATKATMKFKNCYSERRKKDEFYREGGGERKTRQDQLTSASITEMAKRFGIDAIESKANQTMADEKLQNVLYGNDYTQMFKSKEEMLNVKRNLNTLFERIPARIRKETFGDKVENFVNAYTENNEQTLTQLNNLGLVSKTQLEQVQNYNKEKAALKQKQIDAEIKRYIERNNITLNTGVKNEQVEE